MSGKVCEICGRPPTTRALHRDHDHRTGKPRGLLCFTCNRFILGKYATVAKLRAAADYLERYATEDAWLATSVAEAAEEQDVTS